MSFWHTIVDNFIHHSTVGLVGPNVNREFKSNTSHLDLSPSEVPKECNVNIDYFVKNEVLCQPHLITLYTPSSIQINTIDDSSVISPSNDSVFFDAEPSSAMLLMVALFVVGLFRGVRTGL
jgi:hypothetical protein